MNMIDNGYMLGQMQWKAYKLEKGLACSFFTFNLGHRVHIL